VSRYEVVIIPLELNVTDEHRSRMIYGRSLDELFTLISDNIDRMRVILTAKPTEYPPIYENLFKKLIEHDIHPPFQSARFSTIMSIINFSRLAIEDGISFKESWYEQVAEKHSKYNYSHCIQEISELPKQCVELSSQGLGVSEEIASRFLAIYLHDLRAFGLDDLANLGLKISRIWPEFGHAILGAYSTFLIEPISLALGGYENHSVTDIQIMSFLRIPMSTTGYTHLEEIMHLSPGSSSIISNQSIEGIVHIEPLYGAREVEKIINFSTKNAQEYFKIMSLFKASIYEADLEKANVFLQKAGEIMMEQYNTEYRGLMKKEKLISIPINYGVTFLLELMFLVKF